MMNQRDVLVEQERRKSLLQQAENRRLVHQAQADSQGMTYEIRVRGRVALDARWRVWFSKDETITTQGARGGTPITILTATFVNQAAFQKCLNKIMTLGLPLISIIRVPSEDQTPSPSTIARYCR
jgi:hypothetical protein